MINSELFYENRLIESLGISDCRGVGIGNQVNATAAGYLTALLAFSIARILAAFMMADWRFCSAV